MKISEQWLREWVDPAQSTSALAHQLTMAGLEVDSVERITAAFSGVVIGEVLAMEKHPEADRLNVCIVSDGAEQFKVVCGAPNARQGIKVPFARVGAQLPSNDDSGKPFIIKAAKLRGVESAGMLCSEAELELSAAADGLMELPADAPTGQSIEQYLKLDDHVIDIDLTPNRGDCLSVLGVARELAAINRMAVDEGLLADVSAEVEAVHDDIFPVHVHAPEACPRFTTRIVRDVDLTQPVPVWMVERLRRSGIRSIDPAVDVTNYVMLELGQPMHAFDLDVVKGRLDVRMATEGESLELLDESRIDLRTDSLIIADTNGPLALAGIMGGQNSGVTVSTKNILFECAFFAPVPLAGQARSYTLHTDASHRFERGVDPVHQERALHRATRLLTDICGGKPGPVDVQVSEANMPKRAPVAVREQYVSDLLGLKLSREEIEQLLGLLDFHVEKVDRQGWQFNAPSHRFDIEREVDVIEEIARLYGYNKLPVTLPKANLDFRPLPELRLELGKVRQTLLIQGYQEAITYSFVDGASQSKLFPSLKGIDLANPIASDMGQMRVSLLTGLLSAVRYNQNRQQSRIRLFETGLRFISVQPDGLQQPSSMESIVQDKMIAGVLFGPARPESRMSQAKSVDFFDLKGDIEQLLALGGRDTSSVSFERFDDDSGHYGSVFQAGQRCRVVRRITPSDIVDHDNQDAALTIGYAGKIHPSALKNMDMNGPVYGFELRLNEVLSAALPESRQLSRFPEIRRDLAIVVDEAVEYHHVKSVIRAAGGDNLRKLVLFDVYTGQSADGTRGLEQGTKSLGIGVVWQKIDGTLRDEEVQSSFDEIMKRLHEQLGAVLRS